MVGCTTTSSSTLISSTWSGMSCRVKNLVRIGSLCAARRMASFATSSATPDISNSTRPGLTTATQPSGDPLPDPILVSAGFLVNGLSGKMRIQIFPPRRMWRVIAIRAASICLLVIHAGSSAWMPYSPKSNLAPPFAMPFMRPRATFRCLTRLGINIGVHLRWCFDSWCFDGRRRNSRACCHWGRSGLSRCCVRLPPRPALALRRERLLCHTKLIRQHFALVNPNPHADYTIGRLCLGLAVVDVGSNRVKRDLAHFLDFRARDFRATQSAGADNLDAAAVV